MNWVGRKLTKYSLCTALNSCAKTLNWRLGLQIHAHVIKIGYEDNLFLNTALVDLYAKCNAVVDSRRIFYCMKRHDQVSWTSIITGFSQNGHGIEAISMFKAMLSTEIKPNSFTYVSVISACTRLTVSDIAHPCTGDIYVELEKLNMEMKETSYMLKQIENIVGE
ncbi:hypothetical protein FEM48_Zijuj08G0137000 [Ziziphus jujuba var. spinosa]|uniref:Pentatricopeptide repeat-containing protein n=1 Tax=Ziziphus jujuba var. spinosa TaxID=714518 RepID=A0A978UZF7_ZIZJJ|nr:hypothetical protein FEM48_Zijuj08G0137000 [Ziziphus jujuba var. spinosa]